ncbi:MAG: hypothetical protein FWD86_01585 [Firmicutes bacterium]|nr:hypothetical protein [Bacillota bacterium]
MSKKEYDDDDGRTIVDMNVEGMPGYIKPEHKKRRDEIRGLNLTKGERRALFWASYKLVAKTLGVVLLGFGTAILLVWLWIR